MAHFNKVLLMGNVTRDPRMKLLPSETLLAEFGLAVSRRYKLPGGEDREEVAFVDCTAFAKQAELIQRYVTKGKPLFVEGRLKFETWDGKNGEKRSRLSVVVENLQFVSGGAGGAGGAGGRGGEEDSSFATPQRAWRPDPVLFEAPRGEASRPPAAASPAAADEDATVEVRVADEPPPASRSRLRATVVRRDGGGEIPF